ncbi:acetyltransferase [Cellulophaga sp. E16_2]|uniref:acetyltransferase n=1 Tax=Cellulophaga sp. E16_2 TaxID=2789297 RepID=UPI001A92CDB8|nr:acetyltransferase [Cellulophaga sp. E16_2]MBO0590483.1 acetyltransferase [Cellulophaga sp. E16_2]
MILFIVLVLSIIYVIILGVRKKHASREPKKFLRTLLLIATPVSIITGLLEGTWYSHGFSIQWWIFSILIFIVSLLTGLIIVGLTRIKLL